jgi:hypothetical protein
MRAWPVLGVLLVGCFCGTAGAQNTTNLYKNNYGGSASTSALYANVYNGKNSVPARQPSSSLVTAALGSGRFKARYLFQHFFGIDNRPTYTTATIPDPNSKEYLQAFGFKRVGR